jgi:chromosome segregation ATPase
LKVLVEYQQKIDQLSDRNSDYMKQLEWYQQVEKTLSSQVQEFHSAYLEVDDHRKNLEYVISILREEEVRAQEMIDDLQHKLTELSKNTDKGVGSRGNII